MITEVRRLLDEKKYRELRDLLCEEEPADIAQIFDQFPKDEVPLMFRVLHKDFASEVFVEMDSDLQQALIECFTDQELSDIMNDLFLDDTVDVIEEMPASVVRRILKATDHERRRQINKLIGATQRMAELKLGDMGLEFRVLEEFNEEIPKGEVIDQYPLPQAEVRPGSTVEIVVSMGPEHEPITCPI